MSGLKLNRRFVKLAATAVFATSMVVALPAVAQHKANANDMEVPTNDMKVVETGKAWFARRCSFCHGSDGHGAKGPCLSCGVFKYTGNTNSDIYVTIAGRCPQESRWHDGRIRHDDEPGGDSQRDHFPALEEKRRIDANEIPDPYKNKNDEPMVFPK
jgi:hypothetical protein